MNEIQSYFEADRSVVSHFLPEHYENVLEVGCASGGFAQHLSKAKQLWGIEPNIEAASRARQRFSKVLQGTYDEVEGELPDAYFDLVICNDVIEHMPDHDEFLRKIRLKIKPNAFLVGSLPNIRHITALIKILVFKDFPYSNSGILDRTHLRFFTEKSIRRLFAQHGLSEERFKGVGSVISNGFLRESKPLNAFEQWFLRGSVALLIGGSLGLLSDLQYPQYAFRARFNDLPTT
jgi:2-polyprenyl-3-methyl-5-hydroxy-6-metoxy-1,4-benzoquinol methylase